MVCGRQHYLSGFWLLLPHHTRLVLDRIEPFQHPKDSLVVFEVVALLPQVLIVAVVALDHARLVSLLGDEAEETCRCIAAIQELWLICLEVILNLASGTRATNLLIGRPNAHLHACLWSLKVPHCWREVVLKERFCWSLA